MERLDIYIYIDTRFYAPYLSTTSDICVDIYHITITIIEMTCNTFHVILDVLHNTVHVVLDILHVVTRE